MRQNDPTGTDYLVARGLMNDTRPVPYVQSIGRVRHPVFHDTRPTAPRGVPLGPVTQAIQFGNTIPVRTVQVIDWWAAVILLVLGVAVGFLLGWVIM